MERISMLKKVKDLFRRQQSGEISGTQAVAEFDAMLTEQVGQLVFCSDSTGLTAAWNPDVMLFPKVGSDPENPTPSNTGIFARGPRRGEIIVYPQTELPDADPDVLKYFQSARRILKYGEGKQKGATGARRGVKP